MASIAIVYHSGYGHTKVVADCIAKGARDAGAAVTVYTADEAVAKLDQLDAADCIIFGAATYMGGPAAQFKVFADATSKVWYMQKWKDKLAAGFTNSGSPSGDKFSTLQYLWTLAMQHSMIWVSQGIMHGGRTDDALNRLGAWGGVMTQSDQQAPPDVAPTSGDRKTAEQFGQRIAAITARWVKGRA